MKVEEFNKIFEEQINVCREMLVTKAKEYATEDRLHNFKVAAEMQSTMPRSALAGMMAKHTVSIFDMCNSHKAYPMALWREKITDHINYLLLLEAVVVDEQGTYDAEDNLYSAISKNAERT